MSKKTKNIPIKKPISSKLTPQHHHLIEFLKQANVGYTMRGLQRYFKKEYNQNTLATLILGLLEKGVIEERNRGKLFLKASWCKSKNKPTVIGTVDYVNPAYAYIIVEGKNCDLLVKQADLLGAFDKDTVEVEVIAPSQGKKKHPIGRVISILKRYRTTWVGTLHKNKNLFYVDLANRRMYNPFIIKPKNLKNAQENDRVLVTLIKASINNQAAEGEIIQVLGPMGEHEVEMHSIIAEFNLPTNFTPAVLAAANTISTKISAEEIRRRRDYRSVFTITIDPEDAKDFDDALSLQQLTNGNIEVGVHIADVSYYVPEDSLIDQAAFERGNSVYLVDRTIPMLPEQLSNICCSLNPHEDRLAFAAIFTFDNQGKIQQEFFEETVIHSQQRLTYEEAQAAITQPNHSLHQPLTTLHQLATQLRQERFKNGAVNFDTTSIKFQLDENGKPLSILPQTSQDSHRLIEEFMLLANKRVATLVRNMSKNKGKAPTFVYRVHDTPDLAKWVDFALFLKQFGYNVQNDPSNIAKSINKLTEQLAKQPVLHMVQNLAIRLMAKALYTTAPKPHFGLAFEHYTHFTSPIRRYPDLIVHRLLKQYLQGKFQFDEAAYEKKCLHASEREKIAADAERASIKYKQVELMQTLVGKTIKGLIVSIVDWGCYILLIDTFCEGLLRFADLKDDYYLVDEKKTKVTGVRTNKTYHLGDEINVKIKSCDIEKRTIELVLEEDV